MILLAPTAALVMRWSESLYQHPILRAFFAGLDLSSASELDAACCALGRHDEFHVVPNRKFMLQRVLSELLAAQPYQIIVLAAGLSPMALDACVHHADAILGAFEIDLAFMPEKHALYTQVAPSAAAKIHCLTADLTDPRLIPTLTAHGYNPSAPTIIVAEGISYYLSKPQLAQILRGFAGDHRNIAVVEYLLCDAQICAERRMIPNEIFAYIQHEASLSDIARYTIDEWRDIFMALGGTVVRHITHTEMERARVGANPHFPAPDTGWIECVVGTL